MIGAREVKRRTTGPEESRSRFEPRDRDVVFRWRFNCDLYRTLLLPPTRGTAEPERERGHESRWEAAHTEDGELDNRKAQSWSSPLESTRHNFSRHDASSPDSSRLDLTRLDSTRLHSSQLDSPQLHSIFLDSTRHDSTSLDLS
ncbi:hypothetical protein VNO77_08466 [Canavalia gladiata]|uniref:Uncharacterized protein n=1 Tax=Canavalia gladiata TaxID=3824 RepID=A0AAN9R122_CANGL